MSNWKRWPNELNVRFAGIEHPDRIVYPDLNDGSPLVLASDYSGEHAHPDFRVLAFLVTTYKSLGDWEPVRSEIRNKHLTHGRRMSFKDLNDALRINAFPGFLDAAGQLNGVLVCVGVEKGFSFPKDNLPDRLHNWTPDTLNKVIEICVFGSVLIDGLRSIGQPVHWITDDDSIVSNENAQSDAMKLIGGLLNHYPDEQPEMSMGVASRFDDDRRAEDLIAIPDFAAGAFSETLTTIGKENMPRSGSGPAGLMMFMQVKSSLINAWRSFNDKPLKHMSAVIRSHEGQMLISFGLGFARVARPGESTGSAPTINTKWRRALQADLKARGVDPEKLIKEMGIELPPDNETKGTS